MGYNMPELLSGTFYYIPIAPRSSLQVQLLQMQRSGMHMCSGEQRGLCGEWYSTHVVAAYPMLRCTIQNAHGEQ